MYQKLIAGKNPFWICLHNGSPFKAHCHYEVEISYCMEGQYTIEAEGKEYTLSKGDVAFINTLLVHEYSKKFTDDVLRLTVELGPDMFGEYFDFFVSLKDRIRIFSPLQTGGAQCQKLYDILNEIALLQKNKNSFYELDLKGNLYKLCAFLCEYFAGDDYEMGQMELRDIHFVEKAMEMIYNRYIEPLDIESVSRECGYGKSNFCKIFKKNTGETFHNMLNKHRINISCMLLTEQDMPIDKIAYSVGFADSKSFCRVFKNIMGESAGSFKKKTREN